MKKVLCRWQWAGFAFTGVIGTLLHFLYDWTGKNVVVALFSAVNESIWEHMKLLYVPMLLFALIESRYLQKQYPQFWCVKLIGFAVGLATIPLLYYAYTGAVGVSADWFNITIFFIAAAISYGIEAQLLKSGASCRLSSLGALFFIGVMGVVFMILTFAPPHIPLFQDPLSGLYGLNA